MSAALQIFYTRFDTAFFKLPVAIQHRIENKIDAMGLRLDGFPHHRLIGSTRCRLRVGDYRIIYSFEVQENVIHLLAVGRSTGRSSIQFEKSERDFLGTPMTCCRDPHGERRRVLRG